MVNCSYQTYFLLHLCGNAHYYGNNRSKPHYRVTAIYLVVSLSPRTVCARVIPCGICGGQSGSGT
jgi:hypothetical protein